MASPECKMATATPPLAEEEEGEERWKAAAEASGQGQQQQQQQQQQQHQSPLRRLSNWLLSPIGGGASSSGNGVVCGAKRVSRTGEGEAEEEREVVKAAAVACGGGEAEDVTPSPPKRTRLFSNAGSSGGRSDEEREDEDLLLSCHISSPPPRATTAAPSPLAPPPLISSVEKKRKKPITTTAAVASKSSSRAVRNNSSCKKKGACKTDAVKEDKEGNEREEHTESKKKKTSASPSEGEGAVAEEKPKKSRLSSLFSPMFKLLGVANGGGSGGGDAAEVEAGVEAEADLSRHCNTSIHTSSSNKERTNTLGHAGEAAGVSDGGIGAGADAGDPLSLPSGHEAADKDQRPELELCDESSEDFSATEVQPISESGGGGARHSLPGIEASNTSDTTVVDGGQEMVAYDEVQDLDSEEDSINIEDEEYDEFDPYMFIFTLPPLETVELPNIQPLPSLRTRSSNKKITLVLDLDETLVHSTMVPADDIDFSFEVMFNNQMYSVFVRQRPYLHEFLRAVSEMFEVVVFTASARVYAEKLLKIIDPRREYIKHRFYRESCVFVDGNYLKDLRVLGRDLSRVVIVDNSPQAFGYQLDNGVPIESWFSDREDRELQKLLPFLARIEKMSDVRPAVRSKYKSRERVRRAGNRMSGMMDVGLI